MNIEMAKEKIYTLPYLLDRSVKQYSNRLALSFVEKHKITYKGLGALARKISFYLSFHDVEKGDKVALLGENSPNWSAAFWGITYGGAVAVPILPDFSAAEINNILEHSESKVLFISQRIYKRIGEALNFKGHLFFIDHFDTEDDEERLTTIHNAKDFESYEPEEVLSEDLASIIYTSGTTGRSKGVMLTHGNLTFVAEKVRSIQEVYDTDSFLSVLPLSHVYENVLGLILPISRGASVYYMSKPPTPTLLMSALERVKPTMMLIVPLIIEKIYFSRIRPELTRNFLMRNMYHVWPINHFMNRKAGKMLKTAFGGRLRFLGIGGAPLDVSTERFLRDGAVPYSCGYGLTETASLIFGSKVGKVKFRSVGPPLEGVSYMIRKPSDKAIEGEVVVKGRGVMRGYFKDTEQTRQVLSPDGWFSTGDLAEMKNGNLYIRGRSKNMILGPSGENIYPEEIESVLNTMDGVEESVVYEKRGRIIAKVYINPENLAKKYDAFKQLASFKQEELQGRLDNYATELKKKLNAHLNRYSQVQDMILMNAPFEKTPTHKIKRFLYQN